MGGSHFLTGVFITCNWELKRVLVRHPMGCRSCAKAEQNHETFPSLPLPPSWGSIRGYQASTCRPNHPHQQPIIPTSVLQLAHLHLVNLVTVYLRPHFCSVLLPWLVISWSVSGYIITRRPERSSVLVKPFRPSSCFLGTIYSGVPGLQCAGISLHSSYSDGKHQPLLGCLWTCS